MTQSKIVYLIKMLLELLICKIDAELLKAVKTRKIKTISSQAQAESKFSPYSEILQLHFEHRSWVLYLVSWMERKNRLFECILCREGKTKNLFF